MAFIKIDMLDDAKEGEAVEEGEYDLRIIKAVDGESKAGNQMTTCFIKIEDAPIPNPNIVRHWVVHESQDADEESKRLRALDVKRFLTLFGIKTVDGGFDTDDLTGQTARCLLIQEEGDDHQVYNRLQLPKLKGR